MRRFILYLIEVCFKIDQALIMFDFINFHSLFVASRTCIEKVLDKEWMYRYGGRNFCQIFRTCVLTHWSFYKYKWRQEIQVLDYGLIYSLIYSKIFVIFSDWECQFTCQHSVTDCWLSFSFPNCVFFLKIQNATSLTLAWCS